MRGRLSRNPYFTRLLKVFFLWQHLAAVRVTSSREKAHSYRSRKGVAAGVDLKGISPIFSQISI
jgi:hypothetical protein